MNTYMNAEPSPQKDLLAAALLQAEASLASVNSAIAKRKKRKGAFDLALSIEKGGSKTSRLLRVCAHFCLDEIR